MNAICKAKTKWYNLGLELEILSEELDAIESESNEVDKCFRKMLQLWLKKCTPSWESLVKALQGPMVGHLQLARSIADEHNIKAFGIIVNHESRLIIIIIVFLDIEEVPPSMESERSHNIRTEPEQLHGTG